MESRKTLEGQKKSKARSENPKESEEKNIEKIFLYENFENSLLMIKTQRKILQRIFSKQSFRKKNDHKFFCGMREKMSHN